MAERQTLAALLSHIRRQAHERDAELQATGQATGDYPHLHALEDFRRLWAQQRSREQLRATLQPPPAGAGPLNSASLAHRALALMRTTSPGYLQHFMTHLDALSWLEQMHAAGSLTPDAGPGATGTRAAKAPRRRKRRT